MGLKSYSKFVAGVVLHRGPGKSYPYQVPFTAAQLLAVYTSTPGGSSPIPLNISPILPAGSIIEINGQLYRTDAAFQAGAYGSMTPLGMHPSVIGPKDTSTFNDRAAVYWNATTNCFTSSASGNQLVGYAVANPDLGTATQTATSTLTITPSSGQTVANAVGSVTGGTSMDNLPGTYASGDTLMEVECVCANSVTVNFTGQGTNVIADPGTGNSIVVTAGGNANLTIAASGETRNLPVPTFDGQRMRLAIGGFTTSATVKVSLGGATPATTIDGTNKFATMSAFGQGVLLESIPVSGTPTFAWKLIANLGSTLSAS